MTFNESAPFSILPVKAAKAVDRELLYIKMLLPPSSFPSPFSPCPLSPPFPHSGYFLPTSPDLAADFLRKVPKDFHRLLAPALARPWAQNRPRGLRSFFERLFNWRGLRLLAFWEGLCDKPAHTMTSIFPAANVAGRIHVNDRRSEPGNTRLS